MTYDPAKFDKTSLISPTIRRDVAAGTMVPAYRVAGTDYDQLPLDTFLIEAMAGSGGRLLEMVSRVVKPRNPGNYPQSKLTPGERLLYAFWYRGDAVKLLRNARANMYHHVVLPGEPGFEILEAFKIACDTKRAWAGGPVRFPATLVAKALGLPPLPVCVDMGLC